MYTFHEPPDEVAELAGYLRTELSAITNALNLPDTYTAEHFLDKASVINSRLKTEGISVWDATSKKPVWATGNGEATPWIFGDGSVAYSPL